MNKVSVVRKEYDRLFRDKKGRLYFGVKILSIALVGALVSVVSEFLSTPYNDVVKTAAHLILVVFWILILVQYRKQKKSKMEKP